MGRKAQPRKHRDWFVTEAGGSHHKLCPIADGITKARDLLKTYLEQLADEKREADKAGLAKTDGKYTVAHLAAEYLQYREGIDSGCGTFEKHVYHLQRFVEWYGDMEARKLRLSHYGDYLSRLRELDFAGATINHHLRSAKAALNFAVEENQILKNPWGKKAKMVLEKERKRTATDDEFSKLLAACDGCIAYQGKISREDNAQLMREILLTLRYTALRPGELRKLRGVHVHFDRGLIVIPPEEHKTGRTTKEPKPRLSPILPEIVPILQARKEQYGDGHVFPNVLGNEWSNTQFSKRFRTLCEWAGIGPDANGENLVPYSLRHTRLTEAGIVEKWNQFDLMTLGGQSTIEMTKRYVHQNDESLIRAATEGRQRRLSSENTSEP